MLRRLVCLALVGLAGVAFAPTETDARCKMTYLHPYVATPAGTVLPVDGGAVLIGLEIVATNAEGALPTSLAMTMGKQRIALELEILAPGLARAMPSETPAAGTWRIEGLDGSVVFGDAALPAAPAAPSIESATLTSERVGRRVMSRVQAELGEAAPDGVAFVLSSWSDAPDPTEGGAVALQVEGSAIDALPRRGRCVVRPDGETTPNEDSDAVLQWVDVYGQVSPPSRVVKVSLAEPTD